MDERPPPVHLRIEKGSNGLRPGRPHTVTYDKVIAVGADGTEVEISGAVMEWSEISKVGEVRTLEVKLLGFYITDQDGAVTLEPVEAGA